MDEHRLGDWVHHVPTDRVGRIESVGPTGRRTVRWWGPAGWSTPRQLPGRDVVPISREAARGKRFLFQAPEPSPKQVKEALQAAEVACSADGGPWAELKAREPEAHGRMVRLRALRALYGSDYGRQKFFHRVA